ncbi:MAG: thymidine phosphorylase [Acidobacteria bacterium]|nr:thymidine phosphorylase [Acidobacteriota bacterium]
MATTPYGILSRKRAGRSLTDEEIRDLIAGTCDGSWSDAQLGAFLMAAVLQGLDSRETRTLTQAMMDSGELWQLSREVPLVGDKHSTGGIGDKVSLVLNPILAACGQPVAMLTGRGLGHTGGTADKLDVIPGLDQELNRQRAVRLLHEVGLAVGVATGEIAPADRRLYSLRDVTATVESLPLITASILSKKLATGAAGIVFDVKTGDGAFVQEVSEAHRLALSLVETSTALGTPARAVLTDMSQPLGRWAGHAAEVRETLDCLEGRGPADLMEVTFTLCEELTDLLGSPLTRNTLEEAVSSGRARETFDRWALAQGADPDWIAAPSLPLAPHEVVLEAPREGILARVENRQLGLLLAEAGAGRRVPGDAIDHGVSLLAVARLGDYVPQGSELARLYLRRPDSTLEARFAACFHLEDEGASPQLLGARIRLDV